jgi:dienelactone hydrolase
MTSHIQHQANTPSYISEGQDEGLLGDNSFAFEFIRNLGFAYYQGCDIGEMVATAGKIVEGDFESWFREWHALGCRLLARADAALGAGHKQSATESYLHASTYFRMAEFYLHGNPSDKRIMPETMASVEAYAKAAKLIGPTWEAVEIPYEGTTLPGYFYKVDNSGKPRPTLIFHGGFDSSAEELYYFAAAGAVKRGYKCLTWDGPGQGLPRREQNLYFRHDWEKVVTPAVDYALTRPDVDGDKLALMGMSLGGLLAPRAAAFEHRFKAAIFFDGVYDFLDSILTILPPEAVEAWKAGNVIKTEEVTRKAMQQNTNLRWAVEQGVWSFGAENVAGFLDKCQDWNVKEVAGQIECPSLVLEAESDLFFTGQPQKLYDALTAPKEMFKFTAEDGAENHCQSGALSYLHHVVFNWLDETLGVSA